MSHMKEQNQAPEKKFTKMETTNITDTEFKTLVITILKEIREMADELRENFNKEIKKPKKWRCKTGSQSEMNNIIPGMKSTLEGIRRMDNTKDRNSDVENGVAEDIQSEQQQEKKIQKNEDS